jgi:hypothetical protein
MADRLKGDPVDWTKAERHLKDVASKYLHEGSIGVARYTQKIYPLFHRFIDGERSQVLYDAIMRLT